MSDDPALKAFEYQAPTEHQVHQIKMVRDCCKELLRLTLEQVPKSAERTLAIRKLEEFSMWANKAIVFDGESYLYSPPPRGGS